MMKEKFTNKVVISSRISPYLKMELEREAYEAHQTTSAYMESILEQRLYKNSDAVKTIADLQQKKEGLFEKNARLYKQLKISEAGHSNMDNKKFKFIINRRTMIWLSLFWSPVFCVDFFSGSPFWFIIWAVLFLYSFPRNTSIS